MQRCAALRCAMPAGGRTEPQMAMFAMAKKPSVVPLLFPSANQPIMRKTPAAQSAILGMPSTIQMQKRRWKDMCRKKRP